MPLEARSCTEVHMEGKAVLQSHAPVELLPFGKRSFWLGFCKSEFDAQEWSETNHSNAINM